MKDTQFYSVILSGCMAILLLFAAGLFTGNRTVLLCAIAAAGLMYVCQMSDAVATQMGGRYRIFFGLALGSWAACIVIWLVGFIALVSR